MLRQLRVHGAEAAWPYTLLSGAHLMCRRRFLCAHIAIMAKQHEARAPWTVLLCIIVDQSAAAIRLVIRHIRRIHSVQIQQ